LQSRISVSPALMSWEEASLARPY